MDKVVGPSGCPTSCPELGVTIPEKLGLKFRSHVRLPLNFHHYSHRAQLTNWSLAAGNGPSTLESPGWRSINDPLALREHFLTCFSLLPLVFLFIHCKKRPATTIFLFLVPNPSIHDLIFIDIFIPPTANCCGPGKHKSTTSISIRQIRSLL